MRIKTFSSVYVKIYVYLQSNMKKSYTFYIKCVRRDVKEKYLIDFNKFNNCAICF